MKDVIKEILEANEKAKNDIENVEKLKLESAQRVKDMLNSRRLEYIDKAKMNIKVIKKIEVSKAEVEMKRIEKNTILLKKKIVPSHFFEIIHKILLNSSQYYVIIL